MPRRLDLRTRRLPDPLERPHANFCQSSQLHARAKERIMLIVSVPFWALLAALPFIAALRILRLAIRTLIATARLSLRIARRAALRARPDVAG